MPDFSDTVLEASRTLKGLLISKLQFVHQGNQNTTFVHSVKEKDKILSKYKYSLKDTCFTDPIHAHIN